MNLNFFVLVFLASMAFAPTAKVAGSNKPQAKPLWNLTMIHYAQTRWRPDVSGEIGEAWRHLGLTKMNLNRLSPNGRDSLAFKVWLFYDPLIYDENELWYMNGYAEGDFAPEPADFFHELEVQYQRQLTKYRMGVRAGKGYVDFGFSALDEFFPFVEPPGTANISAFVGVSQVPHINFEFHSEALRTGVSVSTFTSQESDFSYFDIDAHGKFGNSHSISIVREFSQKKSRNWQLKASYADIKDLLGLPKVDSERFVLGGLYRGQFFRKGLAQLLVQYLEDDTDIAGADLRDVRGFLAQGSWSKNKQTFALRFNINKNSMRPNGDDSAEISTLAYQRQVSQFGKWAASWFVEGSYGSGVLVPENEAQVANVFDLSSVPTDNGHIGMRTGFTLLGQQSFGRK